MQIDSEPATLSLGSFFAAHLQLPAIFELIGDVGTGKTTFTRGLAAGLGITEPVTSPSFTISKRYAFPLTEKCCKNYNILPNQTGELIHYDFYRLSDPGIMRDELAEALSDPCNIIVVEWGGDVADLLPDSKYRLELSLNPDGTRTAHANLAAQKILDQFQKLQNSQNLQSSQNKQNPQHHQKSQKGTIS